MNRLIEQLLKQNHVRGKALDTPNKKGSGWKNQQCEPCGHAIARAICIICMKPLCKRHTIIANQKTYCKDHKPGYQE